MLQQAGVLKHIIIDAEDIELLAEFWSKVLGASIKKKFGPYIALEASNGGLALSVQKVVSRTVGKNNVHIDLQSDDLDASQAYVESIGGRLVEIKRQGKWEWRVMADPEDNVFCLVMN